MSQTPGSSQGDLHLVCGAGGSRAVLASTGTILACHYADIRNFRSIGGTSGGSVPSLMLAAGVDPAQMVAAIIEIDFLNMFTLKVSPHRAWWAYLVKECAWKKRLSTGVFTSKNLGDFVERYASAWPDRFWTVVMSGDSPLLLNKSGIFAPSRGGSWKFLAKNDIPPAVAVRATSARPGIIEAVEYPPWGKLQDGGLAHEGRCPVSVPRDHLHAGKNKIIACDVGEDRQARKHESRFASLLRKLVCGSCCDLHPEKEIDFTDTILVNPPVTDIRSLQLTLTGDQKWVALMDGFSAALCPLNAAGLLTGRRFEEAMQLAHSFNLLVRSTADPTDLTAKARDLLTSHGLYNSRY